MLFNVINIYCGCCCKIDCNGTDITRIENKDNKKTLKTKKKFVQCTNGDTNEYLKELKVNIISKDGKIGKVEINGLELINKKGIEKYRNK